MTRTEILTRAAEIVNGERDKQYGTPEDNFGLIASLWSDYLAAKYVLDARDVANMMILFKVARNRTGKPTDDSWIDIAGYAACGGEMEEP